MERNRENFKNLGKNSKITYEYNKEILEAFESEYTRSYLINLDCFEFTSLCPVTGQPDFGSIKISYIPDKLCIESKSLKFYLASFRNVGIFHEDLVNTILDDLIELLNPKYIEVFGDFNSRGGIAIHPYANYGIKNTKYEDFAFEKLKNHTI